MTKNALSTCLHGMVFIIRYLWIPRKRLVVVCIMFIFIFRGTYISRMALTIEAWQQYLLCKPWEGDCNVHSSVISFNFDIFLIEIHKIKKLLFFIFTYKAHLFYYFVFFKEIIIFSRFFILNCKLTEQSAFYVFNRNRNKN